MIYCFRCVQSIEADPLNLTKYIISLPDLHHYDISITPHPTRPKAANFIAAAATQINISYPGSCDTGSSIAPCGMGVRIQPTPALRRVVRGDYLRDMSYPLHRLIASRDFLHAMGRMSWDSWALGCPGSGNMLFLRRMSSYL